MTLDLEITHILPPMHPGEVLREEYIVPMGLTPGRVAKACGIARSRIERLAAEEIGISGDTALRLGRVFNTGPELWMNLQKRYEIEMAKVEAGESIEVLRPIATDTSADMPITARMDVISADGQKIGTVDHLDGPGRIKLEKSPRGVQRS